MASEYLGDANHYAHLLASLLRPLWLKRFPSQTTLLDPGWFHAYLQCVADEATKSVITRITLY